MSAGDTPGRATAPPAPCIELVPMPQLAQARSRADDWTGTNDSAARRRAQTRLNTRAYRKRTAATNVAEVSENAANSAPAAADDVIECWDVSQQTLTILPASRLRHLDDKRRPLLPKRVDPNSRPEIVFPLNSDHLITLLQYNVLRACNCNRSLVSGIFYGPLDCAEEPEIFGVVPYPADPTLLPPALLPTNIQQTVPHSDWFDMFPSPEIRDSLIMAAGTFDEDDLWADVIGGLWEGFPDDEVSKRGLVAWSPVWDISGWEMSEGFVKKWGWLFKASPKLLEVTNGWRLKRGEEPLAYDDKTDGGVATVEGATHVSGLLQA